MPVISQQYMMHGICSEADTSRFFGTNVERDFVEAPSQMLENWVLEMHVLHFMKNQYKKQDYVHLYPVLSSDVKILKGVGRGQFETDVQALQGRHRAAQGDARQAGGIKECQCWGFHITPGDYNSESQ